MYVTKILTHWKGKTVSSCIALTANNFNEMVMIMSATIDSTLFNALDHQLDHQEHEQHRAWLAGTLHAYSNRLLTLQQALHQLGLRDADVLFALMQEYGLTLPDASVGATIKPQTQELIGGYIQFWLR